MLDLKKIEKEIDALLESETDESLNKWFLAQNPSNIKAYLGNGDFFNIALPNIKISVQAICHEAGIVVDSDDNYSNATYAMAA